MSDLRRMPFLAPIVKSFSIFDWPPPGHSFIHSFMLLADLLLVPVESWIPSLLSLSSPDSGGWRVFVFLFFCLGCTIIYEVWLTDLAYLYGWRWSLGVRMSEFVWFLYASALFCCLSSPTALFVFWLTSLVLSTVSPFAPSPSLERYCFYFLLLIYLHYHTHWFSPLFGTWLLTLL